MNQKTWTIDNRLLKLDFWISEFVILLLSNYFRWMDEWNRMGVCVVAVIFIVTIQYGLLHTKSMILRKTYKWYHKLFVELCYLLSMIFILIGNVFWFKESSQIHFAFIGVLALLLAPTIGSYQGSKMSP